MELHVVVAMRYFGSMGSAASRLNIKNGLGIGKGTVDLYLERTVTALLAIEPDVLFWPGPEERTEISARIKDTWFFPKAVNIKDGTHLGLLTKPIIQPKDYFSRKSAYALGCLVL